MRLRQVNCSKTSVLNKTQLLAEINVLRLLLTLVNFQSTEKVDSGGCVCVFVFAIYCCFYGGMNFQRASLMAQW